MSEYKSLLFIGGGNIAGAVACGLVNSGAVPAEYVSVYDIDNSNFSPPTLKYEILIIICKHIAGFIPSFYA